VSGADGSARVAGLAGPAAEALLSGTPSIVIEDASNDAAGLRTRLEAAGHRVADLDTLVIDGEVRAAGPRAGDGGRVGEPVLPGVRRPASRPWPPRRGADRTFVGRALLATVDDPHDPPRWLVRLAADHANGTDGLAWVEQVPGVTLTRRGEDYLELHVTSGTDPQSLLQAAMERGEKITRFEITDPSLEEVFIEHVGRPAAEDESHLAPAQERG